MAHSAPTKNTGFKSAASVNRKSQKNRSVGFQAEAMPALSATCRTVVQPCCEFQKSMGRVLSPRISKATYGPGFRSWTRAGLHSRKKSAQQKMRYSALYLLRKPKPAAVPARAHCFVVPPGWTARHPASIASVQQSTKRGSMVIH